MGKQGPCCHCGISTTPLWRNGPPEKPVLCNACGSRWKTKGTLLNYMPMHSGGFGANTESGADLKWLRGRKGFHKHAEQRSHKRKEPCDNVDRENGPIRTDRFLSKRQEEHASISSSIVVSGSESPIRYSISLPRTPPVIGPPWDIPSRKRSAILRHPTPVDKLTKSLMSLLLDPAPEFYHKPSLCSEELLVEYSKPSLMSSEIGLGSIFLRQPVSIAQESESETSPCFTQSKGDESFSESGSVLLNYSGSDKGSTVRGQNYAKQLPCKAEGVSFYSEQILIPNKALLENFPYRKRDVLQSCHSPLVFLEMKDIVNFDTFTGLLTEQEQTYLIQFVSSVDVTSIPESLKCMFSSAQFEDALANFQQLLSEGMYDLSDMGRSQQLLQHYKQLLTVTDLTSSGWMEHWSQLQSQNKDIENDDFAKLIHSKEWSQDKLKGMMPTTATSASEIEEDIEAMKKNRFTGLSSFARLNNSIKDDLTIIPEIAESSNEAVGLELGGEVEGGCFLSNSPYFSNTEKGPTIVGDEYMDIGGIDSGETESLLFDVPNPMSFQQAELLRQPSWTKAKSTKEEEIDATQIESGGLIMSNSRHMDTSPAEWGIFWNSSCVGLPNGAVLNPGRMLM